MVESSLTLWCFIRGYGTFIHDTLPHNPEERAITLPLEGELFLESCGRIFWELNIALEFSQSREKPKGRFK